MRLIRVQVLRRHASPWRSGQKCLRPQDSSHLCSVSMNEKRRYLAKGNLEGQVARGLLGKIAFAPLPEPS